MVQWEYDFLNVWQPHWDANQCLEAFQLASAELGKQGWELFQVLHLQTGFQGFFKRPKFTKTELPARPPARSIPAG